MRSHSLSAHFPAVLSLTQEVLGRFGCEGVTSAAGQLREIANLYVVPPENLLSLMEQGGLVEMGKEEVLGRFGCEGVTSAAGQLREIANLYVVPPENLLSLMEQGGLVEMGKEVSLL
ncbi:unnamed protein product [Ectocarpus sp. CCAP 1310/34]|nr:unnamed protein product [Ectocarpus sp. CCAP 1310/34]